MFPFSSLRRKPDLVIGEAADPYLLRWHLIPKNRFFNVYLHKFLRSDEDRALHDHPWPSLGVILKGAYIEVMPADPNKFRRGNDAEVRVLRSAFRPVFRRAEHIHRVELLHEVIPGYLGHGRGMARPIAVWTLFITGPRLREWGFWCAQGWRQWEQFVSKRPGGNAVGRGCE